MTAFERAFALLKGFGEGFRVHGYDLDAPSVTEAVPIYGGTGVWNEKRDEWKKGIIHPSVGCHKPLKHDFRLGRNS